MTGTGCCTLTTTACGFTSVLVYLFIYYTSLWLSNLVSACVCVGGGPNLGILPPPHASFLGRVSTNRKFEEDALLFNTTYVVLSVISMNFMIFVKMIDVSFKKFLKNIHTFFEKKFYFIYLNFS